MTANETLPGVRAATRRELRRQDSETRILAAAEQVFAKKGFSGATTAMIAAKARLPKANVHYYFGTKKRLYRTVLRRIIDGWHASGDSFRADADPAAAFAQYIAAKVEASRRQPYASKVFANEMLRGAPEIGDYLADQARRWVEAKASVIEHWIASGRMEPVEPAHLFFILWAATQTYADFDYQIRAVLNRKHLSPDDYAAGSALIARMVFGACGLRRETGKKNSNGRGSRPVTLR
jgi:TetR/AcrR family transcriptional regulator